MGKLVREKVIINKTSLEVLEELNEQADKVDCVVMVGVLPKETSLMGGKTKTPTPFYMVLGKDMLVGGMEALKDTHIGFNKEEVLTKLLGLAKNALS